ncbi:MAG: hypothetical protein Q8Q25_01305 [bacterium]|nr:hypothetical protein [bacterium]
MNKKLQPIMAILFIAFSFASIFAVDQVSIINTSDKELYGAVYYAKNLSNEKLTRATDIFSVIKGKPQIITRPERKFGYDRELLFTTNKELLKPLLSRDEYDALPSKNIGTLQGKFIVIIEKDEILKGYNLTEWQLLRVRGWSISALQKVGGAVVAVVTTPIKNKIKKEQPAIKENPYKNIVARIRVGNELNKDEKKAQDARLKVVKQVLEKKMGPVGYTPKIALVISGGGYRAMLCATGFLAGAQQMGLFDATTWITALSGSTWGLGVLFSSAAKFRDQESIAIFRDKFINVIANKGLQRPITPKEIKLLADDWLVQVAFEQPFTLVNIYGSLLANRLLALFGDQRHMVYLSQQVDLVKNGEFPLPIYTANDAQKGVTVQDIDREWYEFTPWEVGGAWLNCYVPTWAYGRKFRNLSSVDFGVEKTLGFNLGTYGSAFAVTIDRIYDEIKDKLKSELIRELLKKVITPVGDVRLSWAEVFNFSKGVPQSPLKNANTIRLADAGVAFGLPYPPVSGERPERKADILIFFETSHPIGGLKGAERYARRKNLKFPKINYEGIDNHVISVFKDETDSEVPVVIYMPSINDASLWNKLDTSQFALYKQFVKGFNIEACIKKETCRTLNFRYTKEEAMRLSKTVEFNILVSEEVIFNEIKELIKRKTPISMS